MKIYSFWYSLKILILKSNYWKNKDLIINSDPAFFFPLAVSLKKKYQLDYSKSIEESYEKVR